jgi:cytochrome b subunit of formate dehydrogenase
MNLIIKGISAVWHYFHYGFNMVMGLFILLSTYPFRVIASKLGFKFNTFKWLDKNLPLPDDIIEKFY